MRGAGRRRADDRAGSEGGRRSIPRRACVRLDRNFDTIGDQPTVAKLDAAGRITPVAAQHNIVDSVTEASRTSGFPLIITTADHVLMTAESLHRLADEGRRSGADALVVVAEKQAIRAGASRWAAPLL